MHQQLFVRQIRSATDASVETVFHRMFVPSPAGGHRIQGHDKLSVCVRGPGSESGYVSYVLKGIAARHLFFLT